MLVHPFELLAGPFLAADQPGVGIGSQIWRALEKVGSAVRWSRGSFSQVTNVCMNATGEPVMR